MNRILGTHFQARATAASPIRHVAYVHAVSAPGGYMVDAEILGRRAYGLVPPQSNAYARVGVRECFGPEIGGLVARAPGAPDQLGRRACDVLLAALTAALAAAGDPESRALVAADPDYYA